MGKREIKLPYTVAGACFHIICIYSDIMISKTCEISHFSVSVEKKKS